MLSKKLFQNLKTNADNILNENESQPFYHSKFQSGLEKIAAVNNSTNENDVIDKLFSGKMKSFSATITALLDEIHLREKLDIHLLNKIDEDISYQRIQFDHLDRVSGQYSLDWFGEISSQKRKFEDSILDLEKEKRKEYLECWRDLMDLKKYLMLSLKEFWEFSRKRDLLSTINKDENNSGN